MRSTRHGPIRQDPRGGRIDLKQYVEVRDDSEKLIYNLSFRGAVMLVNWFLAG